jgi:site-specific DNA recombinase
MSKPQRQAATYLRSSKDRSDVSIDAQRRTLADLAATRGLQLVHEYADVVLSGKDDNRPGFLDLRRDLRKRDRAWSVILMLNPERLARNRHIAYYFEADCEAHGVEVVYANLPESNPIVDMMLKPMLHGAAQYFSWKSKVEGKNGMAENVRAGFRAGGRAPTGYRLEHVTTGAIREGQPVLKSRLVATEEAPAIAAYLKARAAGLSRHVAARALPKALAHTTLIGMEWNALTYAGHTVWNVHNEYRAPRRGQDLQLVAGGYMGGQKRRPRAEWQLQRDTHAALITDDEAERILAALERSPFKPTRRTTATALLTGLLKTPDGTPWYSDNGGKHYRVGRRARDARCRRAWSTR